MTKKTEEISHEMWAFFQARLDTYDLHPEEKALIYEDFAASCMEAKDEELDADLPDWEDDTEDYMGDDDSDDFDTGYDDIDELEGDDD